MELMNVFKDVAQSWTNGTGEVEFRIMQTDLERIIAEYELTQELALGDWSLENEPTQSLEDFRLRYGIE